MVDEGRSEAAAWVADEATAGCGPVLVLNLSRLSKSGARAAELLCSGAGVFNAEVLGLCQASEFMLAEVTS
jgi:hypothetical protein